MAQITKSITVDVAKKNVFQAIIAKQHDSSSRFLRITLTNEDEPITVEAGSTVLINAERADGAAKSFAGSVNEDGTVTVPLANWMLELDDVVRCDVSIIDAEARKLTSTSFFVEVELAANPDDVITDDENYDVLLSLVGNVDSAVKRAESAATQAEDAATLANDTVAKLNSVSTHVLDLTIPANGWRAADDGARYAYAVDVALEGVTDRHYPSVTIHMPSLDVAESAGLSSTVQAIEGALRFWAKHIPTSDIFATVSLLEKREASE